MSIVKLSRRTRQTMITMMMTTAGAPGSRPRIVSNTRTHSFRDERKRYEAGVPRPLIVLIDGRFGFPSMTLLRPLRNGLILPREHHVLETSEQIGAPRAAPSEAQIGSIDNGQRSTVTLRVSFPVNRNISDVAQRVADAAQAMRRRSSWPEMQLPRRSADPLRARVTVSAVQVVGQLPGSALRPVSTDGCGRALRARGAAPFSAIRPDEWAAFLKGVKSGELAPRVSCALGRGLCPALGWGVPSTRRLAPPPAGHRPGHAGQPGSG